MRNKVIALIAAIGISFAVATPANAQFLGPYYGGWGYGGYGYGYGGWGYGGYGYGAAALGAGLAAGAIAGAIAASNQPYYYGYGGYYDAPRVTQRKQIIIKNSPGARVIEQDIFDW
jgi:hypothetical protein